MSLILKWGFPKNRDAGSFFAIRMACRHIMNPSLNDRQIFHEDKDMVGRKGTSTLGLTISSKMTISFLVVSLIPLILLGYFGNKNLLELGARSMQRVDDMGDQDLKSDRALGERAIEDTVQALDLKSTEAIEVQTVELANRIAEFLYERDKDALLLASVQPDPHLYLAAYSLCEKKVILPGSHGNEREELRPRKGPSWRKT